MLVADAEPGAPCATPAIVIDLERGKRVSIFASASPAGDRDAEGAPVIPPGARVWIAMGHTDMRKGMQGLALMVQQLHRNPHGGDLFVFRGRIGSLVKIIWHDGLGMSLYAKRLEKGRFVWPSATAWCR